MVKILILCDKLTTAKTLTNKIISGINDLQLIGITNTLKEALEIIKFSEPDLIISTNEKVINLIKKTYAHYTPGIVLLSKKDPNNNLYYKNCIVLDPSIGFQNLSGYIFSYIQSTIKQSKKKNAINILTTLGFDFKLTGTIYLLDAVLYANTYKNSYSYEQYQKEIYNHVAKLNNTYFDRVNWAIARSINYMYKKHSRESYRILEKYLGLEYPAKPTPKLVVNSVATLLDI